MTASLSILTRWLALREQYGCPVRDTVQDFIREASHSYRGGLLGWLAAGNEPFDEAPACLFSRPWYDLWRRGEATLADYVYEAAGGYIVIGQEPWLIDHMDGSDYLIRPRKGGSLWRLTLGEPDESGMRVVQIRREP